MAVTVTGARGTGNVSSSLRKPDIATRILLLQPDAAPLTVFLKQLAKQPTINPQFQWAEDDIDPRFDTCNGGANSSTTTIPVNNGTYWYEHAVGYVTATGETFRVTAVSGNNLTVVRGVGSTAATIAASGELMVLSTAQPEGDTSRPSRTGNPALTSNYTQIFRTPVELTETWRHSDQFVEDDDEDYQKAKMGIEHHVDIERAFLFGHPSENTSGSQPRRTTGGCLHFISTNSTAVGGTLTEASWWGAVRPIFRYASMGAGGKEKLLLASPLLVDVLNTYARGKVQVIDQGRTSYGVKVIDYISPHGTLHVVTHWLLEGTKHAGTGIIVDLGNVKYRYLANRKGSRDTMFLPNRQAPDADTQKAEWVSEVGLQFGLEKTSGLITGVTG